MVTLSRQAQADVLAAISNVPDVHWLQGDDLCDCTFQRIGEWTNPYLAKTLRVRLCCLWAELYKQYPQFVQDIDAAYDSNRHAWVEDPQDWDSGEMDMPLPLWYRQIARREGISVSEARAKADTAERPRKVANPREAVIPRAEVEQARTARLRLTGWL